MHDSVMDYVDEQLLALKLYKIRPILEVGSYNVNGSLRELFEHEGDYLGVDIRPGPGVDEVFDIKHMQGDHYPLILCSEMLEHDKFPYQSLAHMYRLLKRGGYLILTTRGFDENSCYPMHEVPDYWRFTGQGLHWWLTDIGFELLTLKDDPYMPGIFLTARKP